MAVAYSNFNPHDDLVETGSFEGERSLTVAIALSGQSSSTGKDGQRFDFICGHSTVSTYGSLRGERSYPAKQAIRQLRLIAKTPLLQRYGLEYLLDGTVKDLSAKKTILRQVWRGHAKAGRLAGSPARPFWRAA